MKTEIIIIYITVIISIILNIYIFLKINTKNSQEISDNSKTEAQLILIDRKISDMKLDIQEILMRVENLENGQTLELDETTSYFKSGMKISEIAKKTNKSIKEVELMLKMKGLA